jgi:hypothetical protein
MAKSLNKMMLVPAVPDSRMTKIATLDKSMHKVLQNKYSDGEKLQQFRKLMTDYLHYLQAHGTPNPPEVPTPIQISDEEFDTASEPEIRNFIEPAATERQLDNIVSAITHRPEIVRIEPSGELVYHGVAVPNTNIVDLIAGRGEGQHLFDTAVREAMEADQSNELPDPIQLPPQPTRKSTPPGLRQRRLHPYLRNKAVKPAIHTEYQVTKHPAESGVQEVLSNSRNTTVKSIDRSGWPPRNYLDETVEDFQPLRSSTPIPETTWKTLRDKTGQAIETRRIRRRLQNKRNSRVQIGPSRKYARDMDDSAEMAIIDKFLRLQKKRKAKVQIGPSAKYIRDPDDPAERLEALKYKMRLHRRHKKPKEDVKAKLLSQKARTAKTKLIMSKIRQNHQNYISEDDGGIKLHRMIQKARK